MRNRLEAVGLVQSLDKFISLSGMRLVTFSLVLQNKVPSTTKQPNTVLPDAIFAVDADKQFYTIIYSENNLNRFYKTVPTAEEHNIDLPELPVT